MTLTSIVIYLIGVLTGGGWGLVVGLRNARDIALSQPAQPSNLPRLGGPQKDAPAKAWNAP